MPITQAQIDNLIKNAGDARGKAYAPYSCFKVGAAVLTTVGNVHVGCNVENASYGLTICAERVAIQNAVACGETQIVAIAIVAGDSITRPCGACLQVIAEFATLDQPLQIITSAVDGAFDIHTLDDYLPMRFDLE